MMTKAGMLLTRLSLATAPFPIKKWRVTKTRLKEVSGLHQNGFMTNGIVFLRLIIQQKRVGKSLTSENQKERSLRQQKLAEPLAFMVPGHMRISRLIVIKTGHLAVSR